jgi:hypothetical protein
MTIPKTQCAACGKFFASTPDFDAHRVGKYALCVSDPLGRRCMTMTEMADWETRERPVTGVDGVRQIWSRPGYAERSAKVRASLAATRPIPA